MWIWVVMFDWKAHVLRGASFHVVRGPILIPVVLAIAAVTAATFFLNAVFGFAVSGPQPPQVRPAFAQARLRQKDIPCPARGRPPSADDGRPRGARRGSRSRWASVGVMMICYVAVPARLIGVKPVRSRRDKLTIGAAGGAMGALVSAPPYIFGRIAILMLGTQLLFIPGLPADVRGHPASRSGRRGQSREADHEPHRDPTLGRRIPDSAAPVESGDVRKA
jgi:hypothetical protein